MLYQWFGLSKRLPRARILGKGRLKHFCECGQENFTGQDGQSIPKPGHRLVAKKFLGCRPRYLLICGRIGLLNRRPIVGVIFGLIVGLNRGGDFPVFAAYVGKIGLLPSAIAGDVTEFLWLRGWHFPRFHNA
jgi:hypothetical protein